MKRTTLAATAATLLLASCGGSDESEGRPASSPMEASEDSEVDEEDPFAPNVGDRALTVGEMRDGEAVDTTLQEIRYPYPQAEFREPQPGNQFIGLRLEQCLTEAFPEDVYSTFNGEWSIVTPEGDEYTGSGSSWNDWPQPKFPETVTLTQDRCLTGWIAPEVPKGTVIASIVFRAGGGETVAEWLPPASSDGDGS